MKTSQIVPSLSTNREAKMASLSCLRTAVMAAALLALLAAGVATPLISDAQTAPMGSGAVTAPSSGSSAPSAPTSSAPVSVPTNSVSPTTGTTRTAPAVRSSNTSTSSGAPGTPRATGNAQSSGAKAGSTVSPAAPLLTIDEYLEQVKTQSQAYQAAALRAEGATLRSGEYKLLTRPTLIGGADYAKSKAEQASPLLGDEITTKRYSLGIQQNTTFGLQAALTYNIVENETNSTFINPNKYSTASPQLTLTQSLWRNWLGGEVAATQARDAANALVTKYEQSFIQVQIMAQAETAYWRLALAREGVLAAQETLALTEKSQRWSANRQRLALTDRSDVLQSNAAMLGRQLDLQRSVDEERAASRAFNTIRGVATDEVGENLNSFAANMMENLKVPARGASRDDVKAAEQRRKAAEANTRLGVSRNSPTVNLTGTLGLNGLDPATGRAITESQTTDHPNYGVGITLNVPLDLGTVGNVREGFRKEEQAEKVAYERRLFEEERLWHDLTSTFQEAVQRYKIAAQMEKAQREKATYERTRHGNGRTTLYNVLMFETDYANSQYSRIQAQTAVLNAYAQLKTFGGGQ